VPRNIKQERHVNAELQRERETGVQISAESRQEISIHPMKTPDKSYRDLSGGSFEMVY